MREHVNWPVALGGLALATVIPFVQLVVAVLWGNGIVSLEPNGSFVQLIQATGPFGLVLGPIGVVVLGLGARVRGALPWASFLIVGMPVLAIAWFLSVAYLGGLAGEPF